MITIFEFKWCHGIKVRWLGAEGFMEIGNAYNQRPLELSPAIIYLLICIQDSFGFKKFKELAWSRRTKKEGTLINSPREAILWEFGGISLIECESQENSWENISMRPSSSTIGLLKLLLFLPMFIELFQKIRPVLFKWKDMLTSLLWVS